MELKAALIAAFQAASAEKPKPVDIAGFPRFYVRPLTVGEVDEQKSSKDEWVTSHTLTAGVAMVICDEDGKLLFSSNNKEEMDLIFKQSWPRMRKILDAMNEDEGLVAGN